MSIAYYIANSDPYDRTRGSGTWYHLVKQLGLPPSQCINLIEYRKFGIFQKVVIKIKSFFCKKYQMHLSRGVVNTSISNVLKEKEIKEGEQILTNDLVTAYCLMKTHNVILFTDVFYEAPIKAKKNYNYRKVCYLQLFLLRKIFKKVFKNKKTLKLVPGEYQYRIAQSIGARNYHLVPFGINIDSVYKYGNNRHSAELYRLRQFNSNLSFTYVGGDIIRKNLALVYETLNELQLMNSTRSITLFVCGINQTKFEEDVAPVLPNPCFNLIIKGKYSPYDASSFIDALLISHWFFVPALAEGYFIGPIEANYLGVPFIGREAPGFSSVKNGINGILLPAESNYKDLAATLDQYKLNDYKLLCQRAMTKAEEEHSWEKIGVKVTNIIADNFK